jgi:hypothetical protein
METCDRLRHGSNFGAPLQGLRSSSFYLERCPRLPLGAPLGLLMEERGPQPLLASTGRVSAEHCRGLPEQRKQSQIWSHLPPERRYPEQFPLIFTVLPKGSEGSRRPPGDGAVLATQSRIRRDCVHNGRQTPARCRSRVGRLRKDATPFRANAPPCARRELG